MALFADRVQDTSTTTGTGDVTLSGSPPTGKVSFNTAFGVGPRFVYALVHQTLNEWEIGYGVLSGTTTLVREQVIRSTNADAAVSFSAGTKDVFVTFPARQTSSLGRSYAMRVGWIGPFPE